MVIDTVPVLVVKSDDGYRFIKGESKIVNYVQHACFTDADVLYLNDGISTNNGIGSGHSNTLKNQ